MRPMSNHPYRVTGAPGHVSDTSKTSQEMLLLKRPSNEIPIFKKPLPVTMTRPHTGIPYLRPQLPSDSRIVYHAPIFSKQLPADVRRHIANQLAKEFNIRKNLQLQRKLLLKDPEGNNSEKMAVNKAKELRARLKTEIENRAKTCTFAAHKCSLPRVHGFQFCMNHILQDPRAPYRQCSFVYTCNGKRCTNAAPKIDYAKHNSYCFEHSRHAQRVRSRTMGRWMPPKSLDTTLAQLSHYLSPIEGPAPIAPIYYSGAERVKREIIKKEVKVETDENGKIVPLDPLIDINVEAVEKSRSALNYASESDSEDEPALYGDVNQSLSYLASDDECVEDNSTDPLKHAGIYTAEEANTIIRDKLSRLQTLYVEQFRLLHQEFKMKKAKLMPSLKRELETLCSVQQQPKESHRENGLYKKLKAYKRYYKKTGLEAVLHDRSLERRARQMDGQQYKSHHQTGPKCIYTEGGVKCTDKPMLCSKYCRKHILEDKRQILFKTCGVELGGVVCREPITGLLEIDTCPLHYKIPEPRTYNIRKESTDSEHSEEDLSTNPNSPGEIQDFDTSTVKDDMDGNISTNADINASLVSINTEGNMSLETEDNVNIGTNFNADENADANIDVNMDLDVAECDVVTMFCQEENVQEEIVETEEIPLS